MNENLMEALLWAAVFFETSDDDECHPDAAVKQLEQMHFVLDRLDPDERETFRKFAARLGAANPTAEDRLTLVADQLLG